MEKIDPDIMMKLPMWAQCRIKIADRRRIGIQSYFYAVIKPFEYDPIREDAVFCATTMREFKRQLSKYLSGCIRENFNIT